MKKKNLWIIALVAIITIGIISCGEDNPAPETFKVTFIANGGSPEPQAQTVEKGGKVKEPDTMTKANYSFEGWHKENVFSNLWNFTSDTVSTDITLYAKWVEKPIQHSDAVTITFDKDYSVTIEGTFTNTEWTGIITSVKTALETCYEAQGALNKGKFKTVFGRDCGVKIILEKNPTNYTNYKVGVVGDDFKELYLNVDNISSINYANAISAMNGKNSDDSLMKD